MWPRAKPSEISSHDNSLFPHTVLFIVLKNAANISLFK